MTLDDLITVLIKRHEYTTTTTALVVPRCNMIPAKTVRYLWEVLRIWVIGAEDDDGRDCYRVAAIDFQEIHYFNVRREMFVVKYMSARLRSMHGTPLSVHYHEEVK